MNEWCGEGERNEYIYISCLTVFERQTDRERWRERERGREKMEMEMKVPLTVTVSSVTSMPTSKPPPSPARPIADGADQPEIEEHFTA